MATDTDTPAGCGCCGTEIPSGELWCGRCLDDLDHIGTRGPLHDRTYFARFGTECPFQVRP